MELRDYLRVLRRRWPLIVACTVVVVAAAAAVTFTTTPQYQSSARLFVTTSTTDTASDSYQGGLFSAQRVTSYADLVKSRELATTVADDLGLDISAGELAGKVSASVVPDTVNLEISVTDPSPSRAQALAQAYALGLVDLVRELETPSGEKTAPIKATIVDPATRPGTPVSPQPVRNLALGLILGLLLGAGAAVLRDLLDTTIKSTEDLAACTDAPVLGGIAFDSAARQRPLVSSLDSHAPRVEAFRVLRTNLQFVEVDHAAKVFVVTSALPEEGKTSTAVNLALTLAQAGHRTLLIEADLRRPKAAAVLNLDNAVGVTTVLLGRVTAEDAIQKHADSELDVLASGAIPPNPAELLQSNAMADLVKQLRADYDMVVVDAPPLLPVTDAALLATQADGALLVVRYGRTTKDQLTQAAERLRQVDASPVGVVLNMVPNNRRAAGYGYGYGYGYAPSSPVTETSRKRRGRRRSE
ncbi:MULTISPECIES: polysaccharide biosynthesis tyrosine autokinase [unclassified Nocardioides]|uniref:polysaccharide biosynthesis tyrosine autokinase n=1 Tax=unclassified Nocardioides TaxID=2615069 RepID=UPI0009F03609|nr:MULTISPECIES: polysaccharide biosynthesis tyrosine autokinase [unclassified Nocardioides]GAW51810.1 Capsular exopolysaccharide family [Nocardioides sp. PD653-B2]GAW57243.1 Capsular exopolysaccharide family [Nocardioides sp. PD653]